METSEDLLAARRQKLQALQAKGIKPYGGRFQKGKTIHSLVDGFRDGEAVSTAGRLIASRGHGAITFCDLHDSSGKIQLCLRQEKLGEAYQLFENIDLGDWLGVEGTLFKTRTGEISILVERYTLLSKSLRPLPEKWHGLKDVEIRYRQRYLDLISNEPVRKVFQQRSQLIESLRLDLASKGFLEVETPMMHRIPGGAAGEPFKTHHNALDSDLYLRLAPELHLKRLLVGGFEKVYEINRSFRNEGLSTKHNPEFTMLEAYCAFEDYQYMMDLVKELIIQAAQKSVGALQFTFQGRPIDLSKEWEIVSFAELLKNGYGLEPSDGIDALQEKLRRPKAGFPEVSIKGQARSQILHAVEQIIEPKEKDVPVFVVDYWTEISPLAKSRPDNPLIAERFELFMGGMEVANAYSELNDPIEQRKRFEAQLKDLPRDRKLDEDFVEALEYGMPPAAGLGVGVDRLAMILCNQPSIKDVILFPLLKTEGSDK